LIRRKGAVRPVTNEVWLDEGEAELVRLSA
jgi:hypothetical protein